MKTSRSGRHRIGAPSLTTATMAASSGGIITPRRHEEGMIPHRHRNRAVAGDVGILECFRSTYKGRYAPRCGFSSMTAQCCQQEALYRWLICRRLHSYRCSRSRHKKEGRRRSANCGEPSATGGATGGCPQLSIRFDVGKRGRQQVLLKIPLSKWRCADIYRPASLSSSFILTARVNPA